MAELTFSAVAGALVRGKLRRDIKQYAWTHDYELVIDEDKGWFESLFRIELTIPDGDIEKVTAELTGWAEKIQTG